MTHRNILAVAVMAASGIACTLALGMALSWIALLLPVLARVHP